MNFPAPQPMPMPAVSLVIPSFNERESIETLHKAIVEVCDRNQLSCQIVFVDDGSTDDSWSVIERISQHHAGTIGLRFRRNFGKAAALAAAFQEVTAPVVITMDADLQDDPEEIPRFLEAIAQGNDVVSGWKKIRHDPWHKTLPSKVFNALVSRMTGVRLNDHNCGFKAYRRQVTQEVSLYGERHRFVPVLAAAKGYRVGEIEVRHHARPFGHSKYGMSRLVKGFLDLMTIYLLTLYGRRPLHLIGTAGLICFASGMLGILYLSAMWVLTRWFDSWETLHLHETAIFYYCILAVLLGSQFLLAGLLAELIVSQTQSRGDSFNISERTDTRETSSP
jgi:glycosyltransferase involved in cell wall biosynthesis